MRSITKLLASGHIVLIVGIAAITIPVMARVYLPAKAVVDEQPEYLDQHFGNQGDKAEFKESKVKVDPKARAEDHAAGSRVKRVQDDYYERRRQHWERRLDNRLDDEEIGDDSDSDVDIDRQQDVYERRREYYRERLDEDW